jgi:hypothetical protein
MTSAPPHRSGGASGIVATARLLGQSVGASLVALCFNLSETQGSLSPSVSVRHLPAWPALPASCVCSPATLRPAIKKVSFSPFLATVAQIMSGMAACLGTADKQRRSNIFRT